MMIEYETIMTPPPLRPNAQHVSPKRAAVPDAIEPDFGVYSPGAVPDGLNWSVNRDRSQQRSSCGGERAEGLQVVERCHSANWSNLKPARLRFPL